MFKNIVIIALGFIVVLLSVPYLNQKDNIPDSPLKVGRLFSDALLMEDYQLVQELLINDRKEIFTKQDFQNLIGRSTSGTSFKTYELLTFDNGEMVLLYLTPDANKEGIYNIQDVFIVPDEMKSLFLE